MKNIYFHLKSFFPKFTIPLLLLSSCDSDLKRNISDYPLSPRRLRVKEIRSNNTLKVTWKVPEDTGLLSNGNKANIVSFDLQISDREDFSTTLEMVRVNSPEAVIDNSTEEYSSITAEGIVYYFRVRSISDSDLSESDYSIPVSYTFGQVSFAVSPSIPLDLRVDHSTISSSTAFLSWLPPASTGKYRDGFTNANVTGYRLLYSTEEDFPDDKTETVDIEGNSSCQLVDLHIDTSYYVRVAAKSDNDDEDYRYSGYTNSVIVATNTITQSAPSPPTSLRVVDAFTTDTSFVLRWNPSSYPGKAEGGISSATITGYEIQCSTVPDFSMGNFIVAVTTNLNGEVLQKGVTHLEPLTTYYARVRTTNDNAVDTANKSSFSDPVMGGVSTSKPPNSGNAIHPSPVRDIKALNIRHNYAVIVWNPSERAGKMSDGSPATIVNYKLDYSLNADFGDYKSLSIPEYGVSLDLKDLDIGSRYYVRIVSINDNGINEFNTSVPSYLKGGFMTSAPIPPDRPTITLELNKNNPQSSVTVKWSNSSGISSNGITSARLKTAVVEYATSPDFENSVIANVSRATSGFKNIENLLPYTVYNFRVKVTNDNLDNGDGKYNTSEYSSPSSIRTASGFEAPSAPEVFRANPVDGDDGRGKISVSWTESVDYGKLSDGSVSGILGYKVDYLAVTINDYDFIETPANYYSQIVRNGDTHIILENLTPHTTYKVRISTLNQTYESTDATPMHQGISPFTETITVSTKDLYSSPSVHRAPELKTLDVGSNPTRNSITLVVPAFEGDAKWGLNPNGTPVTSGYRRLQMKIEDEDYRYKSDVSLSSDERQEVLIENLQPHTGYAFRVVVTNNHREDVLGEETDEIVTMLKPKPPARYPKPYPTGNKTNRSLEIVIPAFRVPKKWGVSNEGHAYLTGRLTLYKSTQRNGDYQPVDVEILDNDNTIDHTVNITGLEPGTTYYFKVGVDNLQPEFNTSMSNPSPEMVTESENPGFPQNIQVVGGFRAVTVTWDEPADNGGLAIDSYDILYSEGSVYDATHPSAQSVNVSGVTRRYTIERLRDDRNYSVVLRARTSQGVSDNSPPSTAITYSIPDKVTGITFDSTGSEGRIEINWSPPVRAYNKPVDGYKLRVVEMTRVFDKASSILIKTFDADQSEYTYSVNDKYGDFVYAIFPYNKVGDAADYVPIPFHNERPTGKPLGLSVFGHNEKSISINWNPPNDLGGGLVNHYKVYYSVSNNFDKNDEGVGMEDDIIGIGHTFDVPTYDTYYFRVTAFNNAGESPVSDIASTQTAVIPLEPSDFIIGSKTPDSITLYWNPPSDNGGSAVKHYEVYYSKTSNPATTGDLRLDPNPTGLTATISNLDINTPYHISVYAVNNVGMSLNPDTVDGTTDNRIPENIRIDYASTPTGALTLNNIRFYDSDGTQLSDDKVILTNKSDKVDITAVIGDPIYGQNVGLGAGISGQYIEMSYSGNKNYVAEMRFNTDAYDSLSIQKITVTYNSGPPVVTSVVKNDFGSGIRNVIVNTP